jgi:hypothetical protein
VIHWKTFLAFEEENDLFELNEDGLCVWDILRFFVYVDFLYGRQTGKHSRGPLMLALWRQVRRLVSLIHFLLRRSRPNFFFVHSRERMPDGRYFDRTANDFLQRMAGKSHILETFDGPQADYVYPVSLFQFHNLFKRFNRPFYRQRDYQFLADMINSQLGLQWDSRRINHYLNDFRSERLFFRCLFRLKPPKRVYVSWNQPKALYCAAREQGIEIIEFQHGIIDTGHIVYNYPKNITRNVYCPDTLLTYSDFWCRDIHYPVQRIVPVGNSSLAGEVEKGVKPYDPQSRVIAFISGDVFGLSLASLAIDYIRLHPGDRILFKLHSNQLNRRDEYDELFREYPGIEVLTNEAPVEKLIAGWDAIVLIQSTVAYQALQAGIPVFIYKRMTYYRHAHIFDSPNVRLIDNAGQIVLTGKPAEAGPRDVFFETFNERVYQLFSTVDHILVLSADAK